MKYGCIGVFKHCFGDSNRVTQFEERIVITEAASYEEAENNILSEFSEYATNGTVFLNEYEITEIVDERDSLVVEVASSMKVFEGDDEEYLEKYYYDQKPVSCDDVGWKHAWYNIDNKRSGCTNCQEEREGQLWKDT